MTSFFVFIFTPQSCKVSAGQYNLTNLEINDDIRHVRSPPGSHQQDHPSAHNGNIFLPRWHSKYNYLSIQVDITTIAATIHFYQQTLPDRPVSARDLIQALAQHAGGGRNIWHQLQHFQLPLQFKVGLESCFKNRQKQFRSCEELGPELELGVEKISLRHANPNSVNDL